MLERRLTYKYNGIIQLKIETEMNIDTFSPIEIGLAVTNTKVHALKIFFFFLLLIQVHEEAGGLHTSRFCKIESNP